jgi:pilus assembly protein CpaC
MRKFLILAAAGSVLFSVFASNAAEPASPSAPGPAAETAGGTPAAAAARRIGQIPPTGAPIVLEAGKGTLIKLSRPASTVFIANPDIADVQVKSPSLIYVNAKAPGETVLYAVDADDNVLLNGPVRVGHDLSRLRQSFRSLLPGETIDVNSVDNSVVLSGKVSSAGRAEKARSLAAAIASEVKGGAVLNNLSVATPNQVNLRVKVAEVNRTVLKAIGINWSTLSPGTLQINTENPTIGGSITAQNIIQFAFGPRGARLQATLDALAQEGFITTLAEPNLTATSGQTASFLAGGEFPVPVAGTASSTGIPTITVEFKQFGVSLDFTPTIIDATRLSLRVRPEVSALTSVGAVSVPLSASATVTIPALTVRRAETTVELGSGESFALAGLLQNSTEQDVSKVPALGDLPIIGQLFRSDRFQRNESELVIIVTPYLVAPSATAMAAPTDGYMAPHDYERVLNSNTYRQTLPGPSKGPAGSDGQGLIGPAGFRLD